MKRIISFALLFLLMLSLCMPVFAAENPGSNFENAYIDILKKYKSRIEKYQFTAYNKNHKIYTGGAISITDITGDGIPELFFMCTNTKQSWNDDLMIWTYTNGKAALLLEIKEFELEVSAGTDYCIFQSRTGNIILHSGIGGLSWGDTYQEYILDNNRLKLKRTLTVAANEDEETVIDGVMHRTYKYSGKLKENGKTSSVSFKKSAQLLKDYSADAKQIILSNYWSKKSYYYESMRLCDKSFGSSCWSGEKPEVAQRLTYKKAVQYLSDLAIKNVKLRTIAYDDKYDLDIHWGFDLFNKNASEYDHNLAMAGCVLSRATYNGSDTVTSRMQELGFDVFSSEKYTDGFFAPTVMHEPARTIGARKINIGGKEKVVIAVAVRGTTNFVEWITNASACITGFLDAAANTRRSLEETFKKIEKSFDCKLTKENTVFFLTGHSLGGAVSGILSYELLQYAEQENIFAYTFASPNYATEDNCESYKNVHNILNTGDQVPNVPWLKKRYGNDWYYDLHLCQKELEELYSDGNIWWEEHMNNIRYCHDMKTYFGCLLYGLPKNIGNGAKSFYHLSSIHCPVDIAVYDETGAEMGRTSGSEVALSDNSRVMIYTDGDAKFILSPANQKFTVSFTATGNGTMTYSQAKVNTFSREIMEEKTFSDVILEKGKVMNVKIGEGIASENVRLYVQNTDGEPIAEIAIDGSEKTIGKHSWIYLWVGGALLMCGICAAAIILVRNRKRSQ